MPSTVRQERNRQWPMEESRLLVYKAARVPILLSNSWWPTYYMFWQVLPVVLTRVMMVTKPLPQGPFPNPRYYLNGCLISFKYCCQGSVKTTTKRGVKRFRWQPVKQGFNMVNSRNNSKEEWSSHAGRWRGRSRVGPHQNRMLLIAGAVAASAMAGYAYGRTFDIARN